MNVKTNYVRWGGVNLLLKELKLTLLNIAKAVHDSDWNWKNVVSPFARMYMVEEGTAHIEMPDGVHTIEPGYLYLVPAFCRHGYRNTGHFTLYYIHIYSAYDLFGRFSFPFSVRVGLLEELLVKRLLFINPERELVNSNPVYYDNFQTLLKNINRNSSNTADKIVETGCILQILLLRFLSGAKEKYNVHDDRISKVLRFIQENIDLPIYVEDLAGQCCLNKDYFIRLFKKEMGVTPMQYVIKKKMEKAQLLLLTESSDMKDVALSLSFENVSHFSTCFKKIVGLSPSDFVAYSKIYNSF